MKLYHATLTPFNPKFFRDDRFNFFFPSEQHGRALAQRLADEEGLAYLVEVETAELRLASPDEALAVWNDMELPGDIHDGTFLYSMMCHVTDEFPVDRVDAFLRAMRRSEFDAVEYLDYDPSNSDRDVTAVSLFRPALIKSGGAEVLFGRAQDPGRRAI